MKVNHYHEGRVVYMLYMHDIWVNWFEGEENSYSVCHFHEWRKEDTIDMLDQVPLLYITDELFAYIENDMDELPKALMQKIHKKSYARKGQTRETLDYAAVVTNGQEILVFDTIGYQIPVRKSRLIPRQEQLVFSMIEKKLPESFGYAKGDYEKEYHILSMSPDMVRGLTRKERQMKQLLMIALDQLKNTDNPNELRYWLTEWDPKSYQNFNEVDEDDVWQRLYNGVRDGWGKQQEELCRKMVKGQAFLEKMWELEVGEEENTLK